MSSFPAMCAMHAAPRDPHNPKIPVDGLETYTVDVEPIIDTGSKRALNILFKGNIPKKEWNSNVSLKVNAMPPQRPHSKRESNNHNSSRLTTASTATDTDASHHNGLSIRFNNDGMVGATTEHRIQLLQESENRVNNDVIISHDKAETLAKEIEELRKTVANMKTDSGLHSEIFQKINSIRSDHLRNIDLIETLNEEKNEIQLELKKLKWKEKRNNIRNKTQRVSASEDLASSSSSSTRIDRKNRNATTATTAATTIIEPDSWAQRVRRIYLDDDDNDDSHSEEEKTLFVNINNNNNSNNNDNKEENVENIDDDDLPPYSVTKPHPFVEMETQARAVVSRKSRSQIWLEKELEKKREEEEYHMKVRFKAKPVPETTKRPLFKQLQLADEASRQETHSTRLVQLKETEKPFIGMMQREKERLELASKKKAELKSIKRKTQFKAKEVPKHIFSSKMSEKLVNEEVDRELRIKRRAAELYSLSTLPPRMAQYIHQKEKRSGDNGTTSTVVGGGGGVKYGCYTFQPRVNTSIPDFNTLHSDWNQTLTDARAKMPKTVVEEFSFIKADSESYQSEKRRLLLREERKRRIEDKERKARAKQVERIVPLPSTKEPAMTRAAMLKLQETQRALKSRKKEEELKKQELEGRKRRQLDASNKMRHVIDQLKTSSSRNSLIKSSDNIVSLQDVVSSTNRAKKFLRTSEENKFKLEKAIEKALNNRPHLWERKDKSHKTEATTTTKQRRTKPTTSKSKTSSRSKRIREVMKTSKKFDQYEAELFGNEEESMSMYPGASSGLSLVYDDDDDSYVRRRGGGDEYSDLIGHQFNSIKSGLEDSELESTGLE